jgi:hypothetical protein
VPGGGIAYGAHGFSSITILSLLFLKNPSHRVKLSHKSIDDGFLVFFIFCAQKLSFFWVTRSKLHLHINVEHQGIETDAIAFGTVTAEITTETDNQVFISEDDVDLDCPSKGFWSIPNAIEAIRQGKFVIAVDDEDRENEGDLIMAVLYQDYPYSLLLLCFMKENEGFH